MCTNEITQKDLHDLLEQFEKRSFEAGPCEDGSDEDLISKRCESLFKLDYSIIELENTNGLLSPRYPGRIFIPESENGHMASTITANNTATINTTTNGYNHVFQTFAPFHSQNGFANCENGGMCVGVNGGGSLGLGMNGLQNYVTFANPPSTVAAPAPAPTLEQQQNLIATSFQTHNSQIQQPQQQPLQPQLQSQKTIYEDDYDINKIRELIPMARYARCRNRFVVPVIMYRGKYICRSATISVMPETYGRKVVDFAYDCINGTNNGERGNNTNEDDNTDSTDDSLMNHINEPSPFNYDEVIKSDIQLLNALNVTTIVDLMVEKRKICLLFMPVSSSEKADPENHYENFNILSLPYPGCEFFKKFRDNNYMAKNLQYNWTLAFNDANISIPKLGPATELEICWSDYKNWDLVLITQNYLKATLKYIQEENSGLLIHCISGWDRTPLFISLVRLSLWADGLIHQSLNALQMAYLTLAYDWYLFGHQLPDRLKRGEEIMFFCFHFLKYITDEEFSVVEHRKRTKTSSSSGSSVIVIKSDCCDDEPLKEDYILNFDQDSNDSFSNYSNCDMSITDNFYGTTTAVTTTPQMMNSSTSTIAGIITTSNSTNSNPLTNRSPNPKRSKTSPISVPGVNAEIRQRQESSSSNGSWQVVTDTGSIDSLMNGSYMMRFMAQHNQQPDNLSINSGNGIVVLNNGSSGSGSGCYSIGGAGSSNGSTSSSNSSHGATALSNGFSLTTNGGSTVKEAASVKTPGNKSPSTLRRHRLNAVRAIFIQTYGKTIGLKFKEGSAMNLTTFIGTLADQLF